MNKESSNIHQAVNIKTLTDKEIKKYYQVKFGEEFKANDLILLFEDQFVEISKYSKLLKYKITKENTIYRKK